MIVVLAGIVPGGLPFATPIWLYGMRLITSSCCSAACVAIVRSREWLYVRVEETSNPPSAVATIKKSVRLKTTSASVKPSSPRGGLMRLRRESIMHARYRLRRLSS